MRKTYHPLLAVLVISLPFFIWFLGFVGCGFIVAAVATAFINATGTAFLVLGAVAGVGVLVYATLTYVGFNVAATKTFGYSWFTSTYESLMEPDDEYEPHER